MSRAGFLLAAILLAVFVVSFLNPSSGQPTVLLWYWGCPYAQADIGQGDTVQWLWFDKKPHSVEGEGNASGMFTGPGGGSNVVAGKGFTYNHTFNEPGSFYFHCHTHPTIMSGVVNVKSKINIGGVTIPWYNGITYGAASAIIREGDNVTWVWHDDLPHGIVSQDGDLSVFPGYGGGSNLATGYGFNYVKRFDRAGYYLYRCYNHGSAMLGNITVLPKNGGPIPNAPPSLPFPPNSPSPPPPRPPAPPPQRRPPPAKVVRPSGPPSPPSRKQSVPPPPARKMPPPQAKAAGRIRGLL